MTTTPLRLYFIKDSQETPTAPPTDVDGLQSAMPLSPEVQFEFNELLTSAKEHFPEVQPLAVGWRLRLPQVDRLIGVLDRVAPRAVTTTTTFNRAAATFRAMLENARVKERGLVALP